MSKNYFILGLVIICVLGLGLIFFGPKEDPNQPLEQIRTSEKNKKTVENKNQRTPASVPDRLYLGKTQKPTHHKILNSYGPWEKELREQLGRYLPKDSHITIKHESSVLVPYNNQSSTMAESVVVSIKNKQMGDTSYRALIDSETGRVLQTWDRTIHENPGQQRTPKGIHESEAAGIKNSDAAKPYKL